MPPSEAGTTSPSPVPHSTSVSWAMATSSSRGSPPPSASFSASAVLRAAAALTPKPCDTGKGVSLRILISCDRELMSFSTMRCVTSAFWRRSFTMMSTEERVASRTLATVRTPRLSDSPAPRDPFARGFRSSRTSKKAVACPGQNASPSDTMQDGPPHSLRRERFRSLERLRVTFAVEDRDGGRVSLDLRYIVGHDEVQIRFFRKRHGLRLELRLADPGFGLEPNEGLSGARTESPKQFGCGLQVQGERPFAARDFSRLLLHRSEVGDGGWHDADVRIRLLGHAGQVFRRLERLVGKPRRDRRLVTSEPQFHIGSMLERGSGEFDAGPAGRSVRDHADVVDGFHRGPGHDEDPYLVKVSRTEATNHPRDNRVHVGHLRLVFVAARVDKLNSEFP